MSDNLATKLRPRSFSQLTGQTHVIRPLIHALDNGIKHQAFLFTGTRGVGKTTIARILAACFNCEKGVSSEPCGQCKSCQAIHNQHAIDLIEIDAASKTKVEDTRTLLNNVQYCPTESRYKIYLIDEVHMLSTHSFNALLKTLEEPPQHVIFILATTDPQKIPVTVLSRCLQFHCRALDEKTIANYLSKILVHEHIESEPAALNMIAHAAQGSVRDALSLTEQAIHQGGGNIDATTTQDMLGLVDYAPCTTLLEAIAASNAGELFHTIESIIPFAPDFQALLDTLIDLLFNVAKYQRLPLAKEDAPYLVSLAELFTPEDIQLLYQIALHGKKDLAYANSERQGFEMTMLRMLHFKPDRPEIMPQNKATTKKASSIQPTTTTPTTQPNKIEARAPTTTEQETKSTTPPIIKKPVSTPKLTPALAETETNNADEWVNLIPQLNLNGSAQILANSCNLKSKHDNQIILRLPLQFAPLKTQAAQARLEQALHDYFKQPMRLFIHTEASSEATPYEAKSKQQEKAKIASKEKIANNEHVKQILDTFDGTLTDG